MFKLWEIDCMITKRNSKICRKKLMAGFMRTVAPGQCLRTIHDIDDGFGRKNWSMQRVHSTSWPWWFWASGTDSWIHKDRLSHPGQSHVLFWPKWNCNSSNIHVEQWISWIVTSRGPNRNVDEVLEEKRRAFPWGRYGKWYKHRGIDRDKAPGTIESSASKTFIPLVNGSGMDFLVVSYVKREIPWLGASRRMWQQCLDMKVFIERVTERLIGALCFLCSAAISKMKVLEISRIHNGWVWNIEEATRQGFSVAWVQVRISCTSEPSNVIQEELWSIPHCWNLEIPLGWKLSHYHVGGSLAMHSIMQAGLAAGGKDAKEGRQTVFLTALDPMGTRRGASGFIDTTKGTIRKQAKNDSGRNARKAQDKGLTFWIRFCIKGFLLRVRLPKLCWEKLGKVQHDKELQQQTGIEKSIAGQENPFKIDFRAQGVPHKTALEDRGRMTWIQKLAHTLKTHSSADSLIADLQKIDVFKTSVKRP